MPPPEPRLTPPATRGHVSVARLSDYWYVACRSRELRDRPLRRVVLGTPTVLFRDGAAGTAGALLDRCPHRNVPLSLGRIVHPGHLECHYHGWQFDVAGTCRLVPGLVGPSESRGRRVEAYPVQERDGLVWVYGVPGAEPAREPFALPLASEPGYTTVIQELEVEGSVHAAAENALDVPHTAFLHRGLFRSGSARNRIAVEVRRWADRVEAQYLGEPRPPGLAGRLLSPSGGTVEHWDRFFLPSIAQVEYRLGSENHVLVTTALTPVTDFRTRMFALISLRARVPGWLLKPILRPIAMKIFRQDAEILRIQTETIRRFGGEQFISTEVDVLGREIWRLLKQAERGEEGRGGGEPAVRRLEMLT
jgi:phenylpropionate dioxygenase-like ring-hydroxylating dioxygenase large terminal subunit